MVGVDVFPIEICSPFLGDMLVSGGVNHIYIHPSGNITLRELLVIRLVENFQRQRVLTVMRMFFALSLETSRG